jgi:hypothetical protein
VPARAVRVQVRAHGRWGRWVPLADAGDHGPDGAGPTHGTDPVWTGGADALRLTWRGAPRHLRLHFVRITHRPHLRPQARMAQDQGGPPPIYPRSSWDPFNQCPPRTNPQYGAVEMAFVHHTVTANDYGPEDTAAMILGIFRGPRRRRRPADRRRTGAGLEQPVHERVQPRDLQLDAREPGGA